MADKKKDKTEKVTATWEKSSKRYERFLIDENSLGLVGTIYVPKGKKAPESIIIFFNKDDGE